MPTLDWIGKQAVVNHHKDVPYRLLHCDSKLLVGDPDSGNLLVQGDNLEANDSRHPETEKTAPTQEDAEQSLEFVLALAEILFVLPARVTRGLAQTQTQE